MMITIKAFIKYSSMILIIPAFISCEDFLEVSPQGQKTAEDLLAELNEEAPQQVVNAVYNQLYEWGQHSFSWIGVSSITSDDADKGSELGDNGTDKHLLDNFTYGPNDISCSEVYTANYIGVTRANRAIQALPGFMLDTKEENQLIGEARFLRAYFYWNLVRCFGDVPKIDRLIDSQNNEEDFKTAFTRVAKEEIYTSIIIPDLQFAIDNIKSKSEQAAAVEAGRATSGAAKTFLAKVQMYREKWSEVKQLTDEVIASGEYTINGVPYEEIWRESGENSAESIWEIQARGADNGTKGIAQYTNVQGFRGLNGWGFNAPSQNLVDFYEPNDVRKEATVMVYGDTLWDDFKVIFLDNGKPAKTDDGTLITKDNIKEARGISPYANKKSYVSKTEENFNGNNDQTNKNLRIFRYAEVLLMNAEAALNGAGGDATGSLNKVRVRAGLGNASMVDINAVWKERRAELAMEHDRFFDLVRQGRAATVLGPLGFKTGKNEVFPIPQAQINLSKGLLTQNIGY